MGTLLLRLAAPMQAWGTDSKFETRRTGREPSRSGLIGLIASAMGLRRDADLGCFDQLRIGVRVDREGVLLRDFHMASSDKTAYITNRYYLSDAVFLVAIECDDMDFLRKIESSLRSPAFPPFLGRRSCPPTQPFVLGLRDTELMCALEQEKSLVHEVQAGERPRPRIVADCSPTEKGARLVKDQPLSFSPLKRQFTYRALKESFGDAPAPVQGHDPMAAL